MLGSRSEAVPVIMVERRSRFILNGKVGRRFADLVRDTIIRLLSPRRGKLMTVTADNGTSSS